MPHRESGLDQQRLCVLMQTVLAASNPQQTMLETLEALDHEQAPELGVALYEGLLGRLDLGHFWILYRVSRLYALLGREDAAFLVSSQAVRMHPDWPGALAPARDMFTWFRDRRRPREAVELFLRLADTFPEQPIAYRHELLPLLAESGLSLQDTPVPSQGPAIAPILRRVTEPSERPPWSCRTYGGDLPYALRALGVGMQRPAIEVAELNNAELVICNDNAVVLSADGALQENLSVAGFPELVLRKVRRMKAETVERLSFDEAVLMLDMFPAPNLCHFLLDQATRLELYRRAGADLATAIVIGPELRTDFQQTILRRLGVRNTLGTARSAVVRVRRLWVSSNCLHLCHAADFGAAWAITYLRNTIRQSPTGKPRRLFVSRADAASRRCANEEEIRSLLTPHGFETIVPGQMPYEEQISAFQDATHVIACHGAALANTVLCPPGAHVLEIFHPLYGTPAYAMLAHEGGLDYAAMTARDAHSEAPQFNDPATLEGHTARFGLRDVRVDTGELRRWLESVT